MKLILPLLALYVYAAEPETTAPAAKAPETTEAQKAAAPAAEDSPLVKAAKAAKAAKASQAGSKSATKPRMVIDDKSVKSSKGKLIYIKDTPLPKLEPAAPKAPDADPNHVARAAEAEAKLKMAQKEVESLERELSRLESEFYEEGDPNYRQDVIETRFNKATRQLENARQKVLDAREEYNDLAPRAAARNPNP